MLMQMLKLMQMPKMKRTLTQMRMETPREMARAKEKMVRKKMKKVGGTMRNSKSKRWTTILITTTITQEKAEKVEHKPEAKPDSSNKVEAGAWVVSWLPLELRQLMLLLLRSLGTSLETTFYPVDWVEVVILVAGWMVMASEMSEMLPMMPVTWLTMMSLTWLKIRQMTLEMQQMMARTERVQMEPVSMMMGRRKVELLQVASPLAELQAWPWEEPAVALKKKTKMKTNLTTKRRKSPRRKTDSLEPSRILARPSPLLPRSMLLLLSLETTLVKHW
mmetsp:Transcript_2104/g.3746  ORF Transcript_2104/g.3746 Transcript_2104/m.3746 type:complete len:276 (+) Transcript_2104:1189-2016(+)